MKSTFTSCVLIAVILIGCTVSFAVPNAATTVAGMVGMQNNVQIRRGELLAVIVKEHMDTPQANGEYAVVTPEFSPYLKAMRYSDLFLHVSVTSSATNWKKMVIQNSANPDWRITIDKADLESQRARDPGDWVRFDIEPEDLVEGFPNVFSIMLLDKGSNKDIVNLPLIGGIGKKGIPDSNVLVFTIEVPEKLNYPYKRHDGRIKADERWGVDAEASHLMLSEESGWATTKPNWFDEEVRSSIVVSPPQPSSQKRQGYTKNQGYSKTYPREKAGRIIIEYLTSTIPGGPRYEINGNRITLISPIGEQYQWRFEGEGFDKEGMYGSNTLIIPNDWSRGTSAIVKVDVRRTDGNWINQAAAFKVEAR